MTVLLPRGGKRVLYTLYQIRLHSPIGKPRDDCNALGAGSTVSGPRWTEEKNLTVTMREGVAV